MTNIISYDAQGQLQLTFSFANGVPGPEGPDAPIAEPLEVAERMGQTAVQHAIDSTREMVRKGTIV